MAHQLAVHSQVVCLLPRHTKTLPFGRKDWGKLYQIWLRFEYIGTLDPALLQVIFLK